MGIVKAMAVAALAALSMAGSASQAAITYYHNDIAGSPVVATNEAGQVVWRESYRPYGERTVNSAAANANKVWFTSRRQDDSGLVYMGARYYDPVVGRFISTDPAGLDEMNLHSFNRYAYANNNPYRYTDPDGRSPLSVVALTVTRFTGAGYALGVGADMISQFAAWGTADISIAATSNSAIAGGETGFLTGLGLGAARAATAANEGTETYKIVDGVRRAKAADMAGKPTIAAEIEGTGGKTSNVAIDALRSPKDVIDTSGAGAGRWANVVEGTKAGADLPPILVRPGSSGIPIKDVKIQ